MADLDKEAEEFERQFVEWEKQFENWKQQNINHPDREAFAVYEKQWQELRNQFLQRREELQRARAERKKQLSEQDKQSAAEGKQLGDVQSSASMSQLTAQSSQGYSVPATVSTSGSVRCHGIVKREAHQYRIRRNICEPRTFEELRLAKSFVDVTLACDGMSLEAHRVILSASSPYFRCLLLQNTCEHPIVIMKDVKYSELKLIIDFIYNGEVCVPREQLRSFLSTAQALRVTDLSDISSRETDFVLGRQTPPQKATSIWTSKEIRKRPRNSPGYDEEAPSRAKEHCISIPLDSSAKGNVTRGSCNCSALEDIAISCTGKVHLGSNSKGTVQIVSSNMNTDQHHKGSSSPESKVPPVNVTAEEDPGSSATSGSTATASTGSLSKEKVSGKQVPGIPSKPQSRSTCLYCKKSFQDPRKLKEHMLQSIGIGDIGHFYFPPHYPK